MADGKIKQIRATDGKLYDIQAVYLGDYTADQWESMIHGYIETYVIPTSKSSTSGYDSVVKATSNTITIAKTILNTLLVETTGTYKLGDVILMEAVGTDDTPIFDRWISKITTDSVELSVLETRVQTHTHTIPNPNTSSALTGVSASSRSVKIPTVGPAVNVLTSAIGTFVTSVAYSSTGADGKVLTSESGTGSVSHSHTVNSHNHSITFKPNSLVSRNISAVTSVTSKNYTPHTHTSTTVATAASNGTAFTYVTGISQTDTFIKTLKQTSTNTGAASGNTGDSGELTTSTQVSTDTVGDVVKTTEAGTHKHTVTAATTTSVVTAATVAASVVTSVSFSFTAPTVQTNVVTSVTKVAKTLATSATLTETSASATGSRTYVNTATVTDGVLSFGLAQASVSYSTATISAVGSITSGTQSAGSSSISAPRSSQSRTYGAPTISVTCNDAGAHQHGFSHTHKIATHSHSLGSHTHTYDKAGVSASAAAVINLTTDSHTPHTHSSVNVIATATASTVIKYLDSASSTDVVRDMISTDKTFTTTDSAPGTNTVYTRLSGTITFPGISAPTGSVTTSSASIKPAVEGTTTALSDISFETGTFVTGFSTTKTGTNVGGN